MESCQFCFKLPLGHAQRVSLSSDIIERLASLCKLAFSLSSAAVRLLEQSAGLFQLAVEGVGTSFSDAVLFSVFRCQTLLFFNADAHVLEFSLEFLDVLLEV